MIGCWGELKKPIICLAPMADVTDAAFRHIISKYSKNITSHFSNEEGEPSSAPFVIYTEFVSADGLVRAPEEGRKKLLKDLEYSEIERPIVAQFFSGKPAMMEKAAELAIELGFDGVDINMGCPDKSIEKQGAGAALIKNPKLARELIAAAKQGLERYKDAHCTGENRGVIPVSVKTRLGYNKDELETWLPELLAENPAAITIHARTRKEMSKVPARWERVRRAVEIRNEMQSKTLIIGNGDVMDVKDGIKKCDETGADGAMLGRAIFGNPFLFRNHIIEQKGSELVEELPTPEERLKALVEHTKLFEEKLGGIKSFAIMKKHFKAYLSYVEPFGKGIGTEDWQFKVRDLRYALMDVENAAEAERVVSDFLALYN